MSDPSLDLSLVKTKLSTLFGLHPTDAWITIHLPAASDEPTAD
jgi:hypothetical protein